MRNTRAFLMVAASACGVLMLGTVLSVNAPANAVSLQPQVNLDPLPGRLVISQVYGGGGNAVATYTHDFVELFNIGTTSVSVSGLSVQYASPTGSSWSKATITDDRVVPPGGYYLVRLASGGATGVALPTPDFDGGALNMGASAGKVALTSDGVTLSGTCPTSPAIVDFVGYGSTANCSEDSAVNPGPTGSATSVIRRGGGCADTNNNSSDFMLQNPPTPRNSSSPVAPCAPVVTSTSPADGAAEVPTNTQITVTFNRRMSPFTVQTQTSAGACAGSLQVSSNNFASCIAFTSQETANNSPDLTVFTATPASALAGGTVYRIRTLGPLSWEGVDAVPYTQPNGFTTAGTAAPLFIAGVVCLAGGRGITNARVTISGGHLAEPVTQITGRRGTYMFQNLLAGRTYTITVSQDRFTFTPSSRTLTPDTNQMGIHFTADQ